MAHAGVALAREGLAGQRGLAVVEVGDRGLEQIALVEGFVGEGPDEAVADHRPRRRLRPRERGPLPEQHAAFGVGPRPGPDEHELPEAIRGRERRLLDRHPAEEIAGHVDALELEGIEERDQVAAQIGGREGMARVLALADPAVVVDQDRSILREARHLEGEPAGAATAHAHHEHDRQPVRLRLAGRMELVVERVTGRASRAACGRVYRLVRCAVARATAPVRRPGARLQ